MTQFGFETSFEKLNLKKTCGEAKEASQARVLECMSNVGVLGFWGDLSWCLKCEESRIVRTLKKEVGNSGKAARKITYSFAVLLLVLAQNLHLI